MEMESTSNPPNNCVYKICTANNDICRIRFDFNTFTLDGPATASVIPRSDTPSPNPETPTAQADKGNINVEVQRDQNQNTPFLRATTQKLSISDPKLVKPKCI